MLLRLFIFSTAVSISLTACATLQDSRATTEGKKTTAAPSVSKPQVRRVWVEPKVEDGTTYIDGHYIYVIDRQATFEKKD